ncbi:MAG: 2-C-methyl-D-erythritol 4-phosphate cytidylyltransferase [Bacteroidota bacterium]|nr:2-C-methyl-D-erythritol 4-phosphate cytidylyltransferase [Bacteroidota bacterium]
MRMKKNALIVAGGSGKRMNANIPKQFLLLGNEPVLMHSIRAFFSYDKNINIVLALPESQFDYWKKLCSDYNFSIPHLLVAGGETRFNSVKISVEKISEGLVAIHDGVRPLVSLSTIERTFRLAKKQGNAVPIIGIDDSVRIVNKGGHAAFNRNQIKIVQTPQVFRVEEIKLACQQPYNPGFTDDATVLEAFGKEVFLIDGNVENIKITNPIDLIIAGAMINSFEK